MKHVDGYSHHHLVWTEASYKTPLEKSYRRHSGLIVLVDNEVHQTLHHELEPPLKPSRNQMLGAIALLNNLDYKYNQLGALDVLAWHFREQDDNTARSIGKHLHHQLGKYLIPGAYREPK